MEALIPLSLPHVRPSNGSYKELRRRLHTLGITDCELARCGTMQVLQRLARRRYHLLALSLHPDHHAPRNRNGKVYRAAKLQALENTRNWVCAFPAGPLPLPQWPAEHDMLVQDDAGWGWQIWR
jgi:hypothetical protein